MKLINNLHSKNSTGIDGISTKLLKNIKHVIYKPITMLINYSLNSGVFPTLLKIAKITPVYKKMTIESLTTTGPFQSFHQYQNYLKE